MFIEKAVNWLITWLLWGNIILQECIIFLIGGDGHADIQPEDAVPVVPLSGPLNNQGGSNTASFNIPTADDEGTGHGHADIQPEDEDPVVPLSWPSNYQGGSNTASFNIPTDDDEEYVEITLDIRDDSVTAHSVKPACGGDPEMALLEQRRLASLSKRTPGGGRVDRSKSAAAHALKGLKFISKTDGYNGWSAVENRFHELAKDGLLPKSRAGNGSGSGRVPPLPVPYPIRLSGMKESKEFAGELFDALARRRNVTGNSITKLELRAFWDQISDQSFDSRLQTYFDMIDKHADGFMTEEELKDIISMNASANKLSNIKVQAGEYARLIMEELDPNNLGYIEIYDLETLLLRAQANQSAMRSSNTNNRNLSHMLSQKLKPTQEPNILRQRTQYFVEDNWKRVWVITLWICICVTLFTWKFIQYRHRSVYHVMGYCVCIAKGGAETLKFNMAIILLPVCRNTVTWLRNKTKFGTIVPFDDSLNFHKVIASGIVVGVALHAISHLTCDFPRLLHASHGAYIPLEQFFGHNQPPNYWWFVKGWEWVTGLVMVMLMTIAFTLALPWFRRNRHNVPKPLDRLSGFNAFWYSHHLFVIVYVLLIIHGVKLYLTHKWYKKTTWMYLTFPVALYGYERLTRALRSSVRPVNILKVVVYPGNVLALHVTKPQGFRFRSGQYMFINCSAVSPFEWHPFYITSEPLDDYLSVYIRTLGDWTRQLKIVFSEVCQPSTGGKSGLLRADCDHSRNSPYASFPKVFIDGPYGASAQDYKKYEVVLLVGLGIGATPFISVVKDIVNNLKELDSESPLNGSEDIEHGGGKSNRRGKASFKTRRAYFYWVTREQGSFEWFKGVMNEVAESDKRGAIELHNYCTSVYEEGDARSALIAMLQSLYHAKHGVDVVSGTKVKSHFAHPNWWDVYKRLALNHRSQTVGVFYCGASALTKELTKELRQHALDFSRKTTTKFDFHNEGF